MAEATLKKSKAKDEKIAEIDRKIAKHNKQIKNLVDQKNWLINPQTKDTVVNRAINTLKNRGLTEQQIIEMLKAADVKEKPGKKA